jgi:hypothetical protein
VRMPSLEGMSRALGSGQIVYDPTGVSGRLSDLVQLARSLRVALGRDLRLLAFESRRRTLYAVLQPAQSQQDIARLQNIMSLAQQTIAAWTSAARPDFDLAVRLGYDVPPAAIVVPVDAASVVRGLGVRVRGQFKRVIAALGLSVAFGVGSAAAGTSIPTPPRGPAVAQPNMTIITKGGAIDGDAAGGVTGIGDVPIGDPLGLHIEGSIGTNGYAGAGASLFWRDPSIGAVGLLGSYEALDDVAMMRAAAEAELYLNMFTLDGTLGKQWGDVKEGAFSAVDLKFYATPDFLLRAGGQFTPDINIASVGAEWRPAFTALPGLSLFADGEFGDDGHKAVMLGFKYHFGSKATNLMDRDRSETFGPILSGMPVLMREKDLEKKKHGYLPASP